jgi:RNA polymerase sigma-70 factor (sigma-E family)
VDFVEFYQATSPRTLRYAYGLTGDLAQAQDVVQEAYARAWQRWRRLRGYDDAEAWLRLVVSRLVFDWWRHLRVRRTTALPAPAAVPGPSEDTVVIVAALKQLPERHRQALAMHYLMDMSVAQIAAETGVGENTVKSWLSRGRDGLAAALREEVAQATVPSADSVVELGRRRRRTRVVASVTASGLAVVVVIVMVMSLLGRDRALPPPPTVAPTGGPMNFSPLQRVGGVPLPATASGVGILDGRGFAVVEVSGGIQVTGVDVATGKALWPAITLPGAFGDSGSSGGVWIVPEAVVVVESDTGPVVAVDPATGKVRWRYESVQAENVAFFPGVAVFPDRRAGETVGIDLATGARRWRIASPILQVFGMNVPADNARPDPRTGFPSFSNTGDVLFIADGKGSVTEYSAIAGTPTGRAWHGLPPADYFLAYNGDIYVRSAREVYRVHLADGRQTRAFVGEGVTGMAPCGPVGICLMDAGNEQNESVIVALEGDQVKWRTSAPDAMYMAPIGWDLRVGLRSDAGTIVLDDHGNEILRLPGSSLARLDAGNMLGFTYEGVGDTGSRLRLTGIPAATMNQTDLGTLTTAPGGGFAAAGDVLLINAGGELVVYRIS